MRIVCRRGHWAVSDYDGQDVTWGLCLMWGKGYAHVSWDFRGRTGSRMLRRP